MSNTADRPGIKKRRPNALKPGEPIGVAEIEWCLDRLALEMERVGKRGIAYLPIYERLETELAAAKAKEDRLVRARVRAARFMQEHSIEE
ncbi:hypothetical protein [Bradyrhizobium cenepequi]|uniref:hypothetical protein n=1 Tax=Bradyrhizobium cenepequi TaxID=2821403 RepID=UPI001CE3A457|nr:hypothetical protein [Bradyrhizobium cenepequi]MCA6107722.1 hypothetical protein [Bradyrhizobium cenepequi]